MQGHDNAVYSLSPSVFDEQIIATCGADGRFQVWHVEAYRRFYKLRESIHGRRCCTSCLTPPVDSLDTALKEALLFHYRYPAGEVVPGHGVRWTHLNANDERPLLYPSHRHTQQDRGNHVIPMFSRMSAASGLQRITACRQLPRANGIGFLTLTKSGLLSIFQPHLTTSVEATESHAAVSIILITQNL